MTQTIEMNMSAKCQQCGLQVESPREGFMWACPQHPVATVEFDVAPAFKEALLKEAHGTGT